MFPLGPGVLHLFGSRQTKIFYLFGVFIVNSSKNGDDLDENLTKRPLFVNVTHLWRMCEPYISVDMQHSRDTLQAEDWLQRTSLAGYVECEEDKSCACMDLIFRVEKANTLGHLL